MKQKRYTVGNPGGEWVIWDHRGELHWIAKCPNQKTADAIARILNKPRS